jgi:hypothetical protein
LLGLLGLLGVLGVLTMLGVLGLRCLLGGGNSALGKLEVSADPKWSGRMVGDAVRRHDSQLVRALLRNGRRP